MAAFVSLLSNGIRSNPSTLKSHIPAHRHLPLKYSKRCLNLHQLKNGHNRAKKSMAVSTSLGIEPDEIYKRGGTGVLERPELEQRELKLPVIRDKTPTPDEGGEIGKSKEKRGSGGGERYKVLLLDHEQHTETQETLQLLWLHLSPG